jgi:hypothetical protein
MVTPEEGCRFGQPEKVRFGFFAPFISYSEAYIGFIQHITAPPHGFVRPGLFLSSPGHGPKPRIGLHVW